MLLPLQRKSLIFVKERERAVQAATSEAQHAELIEKINQLNVVRESNMTLRQECEALAARAKAFETKVQQLESELDPTKEQLRIARAELEATKQQMQRLEEESRRWQERNASLLSKVSSRLIMKSKLHVLTTCSTTASTLRKYSNSRTRSTP